MNMHIQMLKVVLLIHMKMHKLLLIHKINNNNSIDKNFLPNQIFIIIPLSINYQMVNKKNHYLY